jgi:hypothetical protein
MLVLTTPQSCGTGGSSNVMPTHNPCASC